MSSNTNTDFKRKFLEEFIVPNFYKPQHLGIQHWNKEKVDEFKQFMAETICWEGDENPIHKYMLSLIVDFENKIKEE